MRQYLMPAVLLLAGCIGPSQGPCNETNCASAPAISVSPAPLPQLLLEDCAGAEAVITLPPETVSVPASFAPTSTPQYLFVDSLTCAKVVGDNFVAEQVSLLWVSIHVSPANSSWDPYERSAYGIAVLASHPSVVEGLRKAGATAELASTDAAETPVADTRSTTLTFRNTNATYRLRWTASGADQGPASDDHQHLWYGTNPFARIDLQETVSSPSPKEAAGVLELEGRSTLRSAVGVDQIPFQGTAITHARWMMPAQAITFEATA